MPDDPDNSPEMIALREKFERWEKLNLQVPMATDKDQEPLLDESLPDGAVVYIPVYFPSYDECVVGRDAKGVYAKNEFGDLYRLAFGPNWYITEGLPPLT